MSIHLYSYIHNLTVRRTLKILCLGGAGFIGSHLTARLLKEGHLVTVVDQDHGKIQEWMGLDNLRVVKEDIRRPEWGLMELVQDADLVIDLIAYANPGLYVKIPLEVFRLNFTENLKIAEACVTLNRRLIQFSTCEVYGKTPASFLNGQLLNSEDPQFATFSEDSTNLIMGPVEKHRWIYASAKQLLERVLHAYGIEQEFNYTIIRPFNFIGPNIDFLPSEYEGIPRVFSFFMDALLHGGTMKLVDGGHHRRCYTYVEDAIDCIYKIVLNPNGVCDKQIFNIGTPENEISIQGLAYLMKDLYLEHFYQPGRPLPEILSVSGEEFYGKGYEDSDRRIPDINKAKTLLGWEPKWGLKELVLTTMASFTSEYPKAEMHSNCEEKLRI
ncbi:MAG TPA: bifunctional UDP-4-keto-pentose/UDP-xylose synthase [Nitrospiraceae bacterium]|nr:bifunctional UDP-4-keto-pentose/UDP-xylose synthase [Nitrospiraceae bacterium]